jgi:nitroreductase
MTANSRKPDADVHPMFLDRWSPRALRSDPLTDEQIASLFEAMRWAPSCFNEQPWVVVHATGPGGEDHDRLVGLLADANKSWAGRAPLLMITFARRHFAHNGKPNRHAGHDVGAAWMALALQARALGLYAHAMAGFDQARAYTELGVPEAEYEAMAAIAVGHLGDPATLNDKQRAMEAPNTRKPAAGFTHRGRFTKTE